MSTYYDENNIKSGNVTSRITINSIPAFLMCNNLCTCVVLKDTNGKNDAALTYAMNTFYETFIGKPLEHLDKDHIQYYNTTEEQTFQYNTVQDYNTHQAMVHIHDAMRDRYACTPNIVLEALVALVDNPMGEYHITIESLPEAGGSS